MSAVLKLERVSYPKLYREALERQRRTLYAAPQFVLIPGGEGAAGWVKLTYARVQIRTPDGNWLHGSPEFVQEVFQRQRWVLPPRLAFTGGTTETFLATVTWKCRNAADDGFNVTAVNAEVRGGGGGGGAGGTLAAGGGGGGGGFSKTDGLAVTPATNYTVTVAATAAVGVAGNSSWFNTTGTILARGGSAGTAASGVLGGTPGVGGAGAPTSAPAVGTTKFAGGNGASGTTLAYGAGGGGAGDTANGGNAVGDVPGAGGVAGGGAGGSGSGAGGVVPGGGGSSGGLLSTAAGTGAAGQDQLNYLRQFVRGISETAPATDYGANLVTGTFEDGTVEGWAGTGNNCTVANTTAQAQGGTRSLQVTSTASGAFQPFSATVVVTAGVDYVASGWFRTAVTVRAISIRIAWFSDAAGTVGVSPLASSSLIADSTSAWTRAEVAAKAPPTAIRARITAIYGNSAASEVHYIDTVQIATSGVSRQFIGARSIAESIAIPTDAVSRVYTANRNIAENVAAPTDAVTRRFIGARSIAENVNAPTDAVARLLVLNRTINESIAAPTDSVARVLAANRTINENIAAPTDSVARLAQFNRSIAESIAKPTDVVARTFNGARTITENVAAPTDAVTRLVVFNRNIIEQLPGPGGGGTTIQPIFNVFD